MDSTSDVLQLPAEIMEIGDNQELNTTMIQQLDTAATHLDAWIAGGGRLESTGTCRQLRGFLKGMNVYPRLPLGFRLQALDELAQACRTCDPEIALAMLTGYQHSLSQLPGDEYARFRIQIIAHALNLALRFYRYWLFGYKSVDIRVINRVLYLSRIGLGTQVASTEDHAAVLALKHAISRHELIRRLDFFGQTRHTQEQVWQDAGKLTEALDIHCLDANQPIPGLAGSTFMVSDPGRPASPPSIVTHLPAHFPYDAWVIPVHTLLKQVRLSRQQYKILSGQTEEVNQHHNVQERQATALASAECILEALSQSRRASARQSSASHKISIEWDAAEAIATSQGSERAHHHSPEMWSIANMDKGGIGLECASPAAIQAKVDSLLGIIWPCDSGHPSLGFLRWWRSGVQGGCRLGIEFFRLEADVKKCITAGNSPMRRVIPVLILAGAKSSTAIFPVVHLSAGASFVMIDAGARKAIRIGKALKNGPNYTVCRIEDDS